MSYWSEQNKVFLGLPASKLLAITAYGEAGGEGVQGMIAVVSVIRNRTKSRQFYDNEIYGITNSPWHAVILKYKQFSMYNPDNPVRPVALRIAMGWDSELAKKSTLRTAFDIGNKAINGTLIDNTGGADHYFANYIAAPVWASAMTFIGQVGKHLFYTVFPSSKPTEEAPTTPPATKEPKPPVEEKEEPVQYEPGWYYPPETPAYQSPEIQVSLPSYPSIPSPAGEPQYTPQTYELPSMPGLEMPYIPTPVVTIFQDITKDKTKLILAGLILAAIIAIMRR